EKLELGEVRIRVVLEADGTQVEDPEYFSTLPENTVFLLLRQGEHWYPAGVEVLRQAITAIPKIVCETIYSLGLHDEAPVWKIMDQYGKITVVLSWEPCQRGHHHHASSSSPRKPVASARVIVSGIGESRIQRHDYLVAQTSLGGSTPSPQPTGSLGGNKSPVPTAQITHGTVTTIRDGKKETLINDIGSSTVSTQPASLHQGSVINHDGEGKSSYMSSGGGGLGGRLSRQGSSVESTHSQQTVHIHTPECCSYGHPHNPSPRARASPTGDVAECDFHCCSLHEEGGRIQASRQHLQQHGGSGSTSQRGSLDSQPSLQRPSNQVHKATSPIQDSQDRRTSHHQPGTPGKSAAISADRISVPDGICISGQKSSPHVRFLPEFKSSSTTKENRTEADSSESETENTTNDEEAHTTQKFLLLTDQLSVDTKKHLTIKDIGVILDRLSSKIIDVEKLDRESDEIEDSYNWTIKATIRGDSLRELGVVYGGHYYSISEHPAYSQKRVEEEDENVENVEKEAEEEPV
ncbi:unnamed protein product, partial [Meganyctiphanes norvegica]